MRPYRETAYADLRVSYKRHLDGGGSTFGQDFLPLLRRRGMPKAARAFEWCAGPGFIGFSLLANGLCDTLCLADVNPEAVAACRRTVARNRLESKVAVYQSDNLAGIPAGEQWDLVVSNPPHFIDSGIGQLRYHDPDWRVHRGLLRERGASPESRGRGGAAGEQCRLDAGDVQRDDRGGGPDGSCSCRTHRTRAPRSRTCSISGSCALAMRSRPGRGTSPAAPKCSGRARIFDVIRLILLP